MDACFPDPDIERLPPSAVRLTHLKAVPLVDRRRIHLSLELTPFEKPPDITLTLLAPDGTPCGFADIVEPAGWKVHLTMHIRSPISRPEGPPAGQYELTARVLYPEIGTVDQQAITFTLPSITR